MEDLIRLWSSEWRLLNEWLNFRYEYNDDDDNDDDDDDDDNEDNDNDEDDDDDSIGWLICRSDQSDS